MKYISILTAFNVALASVAHATDEHLDQLKVGNDLYKNVTVTRVSATDIYFTHGSGIANAKLKNLTLELQQHFGYNATRAKAAEQAQHSVGQPVQYHFRVAAATNSSPQNKQGIKLELDDAMARVRVIVNQPVTQLPLTQEMSQGIGYYGKGWFHDGANRPDFNTADVRKTVEGSYAKFKYVTSNLTPGVAFLGSELSFNPQLKYFYTDRSLPKKKLSEAEMVEINRLYRIIGEDEAALADK
jgi:hypothetical protein